MKKEADSRGAELEPISLTFGMSSGIGVKSTSAVWAKLFLLSVFCLPLHHFPFPVMPIPSVSTVDRWEKHTEAVGPTWWLVSDC